MKFRPTIGTDMSGRLGGVVASHNTYGSYFRSLVRPVNVNSPGQQLVRQTFGQLSQAWRGLTPTQRNGFVSAAPALTVPDVTGGSLILTGQALFMRVNQLKQLLLQPVLNTPPTSTVIPKLSTPTVTVFTDGSVGIDYVFSDPWNVATGGVQVSVSPLQSPGRSFIGQYLNLVGGATAGVISTTVTLNLPMDISSGGLLRFRFRAVTDDGRLSPFIYVDATVPSLSSVVSVVTASATHTTVTFDKPVTAADFAPTDLVPPAGTPASVAQSSPTVLDFVGTGYTVGIGLPVSLTPTGTAATYVVPFAGVTV
jgi:hypothetical protein